MNDQLKQIQEIIKNKITNCIIIIRSDFVNHENDNVINWKSIKISINQQNTKSIQKIYAYWWCDQKKSFEKKLLNDNV